MKGIDLSVEDSSNSDEESERWMIWRGIRSITIRVSKIEIEGYIYNGISNYGIRPTFDGEKLLLETYLFDFSKDIYGMDIVVSFVEFIRDEKRFDSVDELKKQINLDIDKTIKILGS